MSCLPTCDVSCIQKNAQENCKKWCTKSTVASCFDCIRQKCNNSCDGLDGQCFQCVITSVEPDAKCASACSDGSADDACIQCLSDACPKCKIEDCKTCLVSASTNCDTCNESTDKCIDCLKKTCPNVDEYCLECVIDNPNKYDCKSKQTQWDCINEGNPWGCCTWHSGPGHQPGPDANSGDSRAVHIYLAIGGLVLLGGVLFLIIRRYRSSR